MTKDKLKQNLKIGDNVIVKFPGYGRLIIGKITSISFNYVGVILVCNNSLYQFLAKDIIKINDQIYAAKMNYPENYI